MGPEPDWDAEARDLALTHEEPLDEDEARDELILRFLELGDPRPLIHFLKNGHDFGPTLRHYLALMLSDAQTPFPPFRLVTERRRNRRRKKPFPSTASNEWRDGKAALRVNAILRKVGYQEAIEQVAREMGIGSDTVRKAHDRICGGGKKQR